jgi:hypothetical protein
VTDLFAKFREIANGDGGGDDWRWRDHMAGNLFLALLDVAHVVDSYIVATDRYPQERGAVYREMVQAAGRLRDAMQQEADRG